MAVTDNDNRYFDLLAKALRVCAKYKPMFGKGRKGGMSLEQFQAMYGADPFYHWVGLDSPLMYAAHKAAGGMTSIYRQIGIGCEWIVGAVLRDGLGLSHSEATWNYQIPTPKGKPRTLSLDGRIDISHVREVEKKKRVQEWMEQACDKVLLEGETRKQVKGVVFEVRQGYKSKDSKRQNADIANATSAYVNQYIPVLFLLSTQIDGDLATRYIEARWLLMTGSLEGTALESAYVFCREVVGYDLAAFFARNSDRIKVEFNNVLQALLAP